MSEAVNESNDETNTSKNTKYLLSTIDNPINPFEDFKQWLVWDTSILGHNTCGVVATHCNTGIDASEEESAKDYEQACDDIILHDAAGIFIKVKGE